MGKLIDQLGLQHGVRTDNVARYVLQCGLATLVVLIVLLVLDALTQTVLIAALGATAFIAFAVPRSVNADPRHMIGGYLVGTWAGGVMGFLHSSMIFPSLAIDHAFLVSAGALATGLAMFLMVITRTEHPPAAALALGLVLNEWDWQTLAFIIGGVVVMTIVKQLVMPLLMDLL